MVTTGKKKEKKKGKKSENKPESKMSKKPPEKIDESLAVDYDDEEALSDDGNITSDEEQASDDERRHQKLLEAISSIGGNKKKLHERSEAALLVSEFSVHAEGEGDKVDMADLIGTIDQTPAVSNKTRKQLKHFQSSSKPVSRPLSRQETERIQRDLAFQKSSAEVSRWQSVVRQNERAEQLVFPLNQEPARHQPLERLVSGWKSQTPLEQEIFQLLSVNHQPSHKVVLTPVEEASLKAMSLEEARIRRAELQKARALQSYYEAKANRERRIKSKKYHKLQNRTKRKELLKQFEEKVKTDPSAALEDLNKMEVSRMQERMSLKHQSSGKWARSKAIMAKYDLEARRALHGQLEVNKDLTQKMVTSLNQEEEEEEETGVLPDFVNDGEKVLDPSNPWMRGKLSEEPASAEDGLEAEAAPEAAGCTVEEESEPEVEETEEEVLLRQFEAKRKLREAEETSGNTEEGRQSEAEAAEPEPSGQEEAVDPEPSGQEEAVDPEPSGQEEAVDPEPSGQEEAVDSEQEEEEEEELTEFTSLYQKVADGHRGVQMSEAETPAILQEALVRIRTLEDLELICPEELTSGPPAGGEPAPEVVPPVPELTRKRKRSKGVDLKDVLTKKASILAVPLAPVTLGDGDDGQEQRDVIMEAFAGDDIVSDFLKDKRRQEEAGKPKDVDLTLPGWGAWGGLGTKAPRLKRRRFRIQAKPPPPRRDVRLPAVIISEKRNSSISLHQVSSLPFPFEKPSQFEGTIRAPLGGAWNTHNTLKKITKPKVLTRLGAFIQPISREVLLEGGAGVGGAEKTLNENTTKGR